MYPKLHCLGPHLNVLYFVNSLFLIKYEFTLIGSNKGDDGEKSQHPAPERHGDQGGTELSCQLRIAIESSWNRCSKDIETCLSNDYQNNVSWDQIEHV